MLFRSPYAMIGYCYARLGEDAQAVKYYQQALTRNKGHFWLMYDLGVLYYRMKDPARAYAALQSIVDRDIPSLAGSAVLSGLSRMPAGSRQLLFAKAGDFAVDLKKKSIQMMAGMDYERSSGRSLGIKAAPVLHPWAFYIQPGKEVFF